MTAPVLSNYLADLAERAGDAFRLGQSRTVEAATAYLDCGRLLAEAKAEAGHGQWLPFLERAGIAGRSASRMMKLAASGVDAATLAERGVRAVSESMARPAKPATVADLQETPTPEIAGNDNAARKRQRRAERREAGLCIDCGKAAAPFARCVSCRAGQGGRDSITRAVRMAARAGKGLSAAECRELAERGRRRKGR